MKPTNTNNPLGSERSSRVSFLNPPNTEEEALENLREALREIKLQPSPADIELSLSQPLTPLAPHNSPKVITRALEKSEDRIKGEAEAERERQAQEKKTRRVISSQRVKPQEPDVIYDPVAVGYKKQRNKIEQKQEENSFYAKTKKAFSSFQNGFMKFADTIAKSFGFETFTEKSLRKKSEKDKKTVNKGLPRVQPNHQTNNSEERAVIFESSPVTRKFDPVVFRDDRNEPQTPEQKHRERFGNLTTSPQPRKNETGTAKGGEGKNKSDRLKNKRAEMLRTLDARGEEGNIR